MWCEEINEKFSALHRSTVWWFRPTRGEIVRYEGADHPDYRPLPWPARDDSQLDYTLQLLAAFYAKPSDFINRCSWVNSGNHPLRYPQVRAWVLRNLVSPADGPGASYFRQDRGTVAAAMPSALRALFGRLAINILTDPGATSLGGASNYPTTARRPTQDEYEDVVVALCEIILVTPLLDVVAWPWLWTWAAGAVASTAGGSLVSSLRPKARTRVFALKAIGAIVGRGTVRASAGVIASMEQLVASIEMLPPPTSFQEEREQWLLISDATFVIGTLAAKLQEQSISVPGDLINYQPPPRPWPVWVPVVGALSAAATFVGATLLLRPSRAAGVVRGTRRR